MVLYYPEKQPSLQRFRQASSDPVGGMIASFILDQTHSTFTNLDVLSGRVVLRLATSTNVNSVVVKLEGESRTRLLPPPTNEESRPRPVREVHKILYKLQMVFPPPNLVTTGKSSFTLPAGHHEYPFSFKVPFNNSCNAANSVNPSISLGGSFGLEISRAPMHHVKKMLPPTFTGFPGEADIRYFLKATVARPNILKENARAYLPFNFCPLESPRPSPAVTGAETFARRKHQFMQPYGQPIQVKAKKSLFSRKSTMNLAAPIMPAIPEAPFISVEARLPEPPILTVGQEIPLRLICGVLNTNTHDLTLRSLEVALIHYTHIQAQNIRKTAALSIVMTSRSNIMNAPIIFKEGSTEVLLDPTLWRGLPIPSNLPPSFETCNLSRNYELIVRVGIGYEARIQPQHTVMELRLPFQLFSGIRPPAELLEAMTGSYGMNGPAQNPPLPPRNEKTGLAAAAILRRPVPAPHLQAQQQPTPSSVNPNGNHMQPAPLPHRVDEPPQYSEAPPSYEDAIADTMPSVETSHRPQYAPPPPEQADSLLSAGEKRGWH